MAKFMYTAVQPSTGRNPAAALLSFEVLDTQIHLVPIALDYDALPRAFLSAQLRAIHLCGHSIHLCGLELPPVWLSAFTEI